MMEVLDWSITHPAAAIVWGFFTLALATVVSNAWSRR